MKRRTGAPGTISGIAAEDRVCSSTIMSPTTTPPRLETIAAESAKFTAPLLFVHGLWGSAAVWRKFMGYCAHRGWTCHALVLPGGGRSAATHDPLTLLGEMANSLTSSVATMPGPPILIGHDLGGLLALSNPGNARAVVALAPLWGSSIETVRKKLGGGWKNRVAYWRDAPITPSPGRWYDEYMPAAAERLRLATTESARFVRSLEQQAEALNLRAAAPVLVVAGQEDLFAPPPHLRRLATQLGAEHTVIPDTRHALPWDQGWDRAVATVHRWLVKTMGESLLVERDADGETIDG